MTLLNLAPANYNFNPALYSSNVGKSDNIGAYGTVCNGTAAEGKFVNTPGKLEPSIQSGGDGYGFTGNFPGKIIGPDAGYLGIDKYSMNGSTFPRAGYVAPLWKNLTGGKRTRRYAQIGCKKMGGKHRSHRRMRSHSKRSHRHKRSHSKRMHSKRMHMRSHRRMTRHRGGNGMNQPYSNIPISYGQSLGPEVSAQNSGLANPPPFFPYNRCASVPRG